MIDQRGIRSDESSSDAVDIESALRAEREHGLANFPTPWRTVIGIVIGVLAVLALRSVLTNPRMQWNVFREYFFNVDILAGLRMTLLLTAISLTLAFLIGGVFATMRLSQIPLVRTVSWTFTWFFRSVPLLVQLLFWFNIGYLYPTIFSIDAVDLISPIMAAVLGLSLNGGSYAAEIIRGGLLSVDSGQIEAADALAFPRGLTFARVVFPQAMRSIIPPAGNLSIEMSKGTALVSVIAVSDLLYSAQIIYNMNYLIVPLLMVVTVWYLLLTSLMAVVQYYIERYFAKGGKRPLPLTPFQRAKAWSNSRLQPTKSPSLDRGGAS